MSLQNPLIANEAMYSTVKGDYFYPQTVASQVIMEDGSRLNAYLGGIVVPSGYELLWENPNPSVEFANQTLNIEKLNDCNLLYILFRRANNDSKYVFISILNDGFTFTISDYYGSNQYRDIKLNGNNIEFLTASDASKLIPCQIYGIKENVSLGGEGTLLNADMLGGVAAEEYVKKSETGMTLLWTNASPTSEFAAQTITVNNEKYKEFLIVFIMNNSGTDQIIRTMTCIKGYKNLLSTGADRILSRYVTINNNAFVFTGGYYQGAIGNSTSDTGHNKFAVPLFIYGVK